MGPRPGKGQVTINGRELANYFPNEKERNQVLDPLKLTERLQTVMSLSASAEAALLARQARANWASPVL